MPDEDVTIRIAAKKGDTAAIPATKAELDAASKSADDLTKTSDEASKALDRALTKPRPKVDHDFEERVAKLNEARAALERAIAKHEANEVPTGPSAKDQTRGLVANTRQIRDELSVLLNLPGDRTRQEIEEITQRVDVLRANAKEALDLARGAEALGDIATGTRLRTVAREAERAALLQSTFRPKAPPRDRGNNVLPGEAQGIGSIEATALAAGLRQTGVQGGFVSSTLLRVASTAGVARLALFGLVGVVGGAAVGAFAGLVGWLAKGAAATPAFQAGLENLHGATKGLGDELNRAARPLTDFLGEIAGNGLTAFAGLLDGGRDALRGFNDASGTAAARASAAEDHINALGGAADMLKTRLEGATQKLRESNEALAENALRGKEAVTAANALDKANEALGLAKIDQAVADKKISSDEAERQRLALTGDTQGKIDQREVERADSEAKAREAAAIAARKKESGGDASIEFLKRQLAAAKAAPRESMEETKARVNHAYSRAIEHNNGVVPDEIQAKYQPANDEANATPNKAIDDAQKSLDAAIAAQKAFSAEARKSGDALLAAKNAAALLHVQLAANTAQQAAAVQKQKNQAADAAAKAEAEQKQKALQTDLKNLQAAHQARLAHIEEEGGAASAQAQKELEAERAYQEERVKNLDEASRLQGTYDADHQQHLDEQSAALDHGLAKLKNVQEREAAAKEREDKKTDRAADDAWKAGVRPGFIDARSQTHRDASGNIIEQRGELQNGATRDSMGFVEGPSQLGPKLPAHGPPAAATKAAAGDNGAAEAIKAVEQTISTMLSNIVAAVKAMGASVQAKGGEAVSAIEDVGGRVDSVGSAVVSKIQNLNAKVDAVGRGT